MTLSTNDLARARRFLSDLGTSEVQSLAITSATGGTFTLTYSGQTTSAVAYNAVAGTIQNALTSLSNIGVGNITVRSQTQTGGSPFNITFQGTLANIAVAVIMADGTGLTGAGASAVVTETVIGGITAFSDAELIDNDDLGNNNFYMGIYYDVLQLLGDAAKMIDYALGQTNQHESQIFDHLHQLAEDFLAKALATRQVSVAGMHPIPPRRQPKPYQPGTTLGSGANGWTPNNRNGWNDGGDW